MQHTLQLWLHGQGCRPCGAAGPAHAGQVGWPACNVKGRCMPQAGFCGCTVAVSKETKACAM